MVRKRPRKKRAKNCHNYSGCTEGQVRLVGGSSDNEGTIEICHDNLWGLITDAGWDNKDAVVICRQLHLSSESMLHVCVLPHITFIQHQT